MSFIMSLIISAMLSIEFISIDSGLDWVNVRSLFKLGPDRIQSNITTVPPQDVSAWIYRRERYHTHFDFIMNKYAYIDTVSIMFLDSQKVELTAPIREFNITGTINLRKIRWFDGSIQWRFDAYNGQYMYYGGYSEYSSPLLMLPYPMDWGIEFDQRIGEPAKVVISGVYSTQGIDYTAYVVEYNNWPYSPTIEVWAMEYALVHIEGASYYKEYAKEKIWYEKLDLIDVVKRDTSRYKCSKHKDGKE